MITLKVAPISDLRHGRAPRNSGREEGGWFRPQNRMNSLVTSAAAQSRAASSSFAKPSERRPNAAAFVRLAGFGAPPYTFRSRTSQSTARAGSSHLIKRSSFAWAGPA